MHTHPENHFKYCPQCASKGFFSNDDFSFKCPECGFHFYLNSAAAVTGLIFNSEGKLLLTRRAIEPSKGKPDLPGGFIDPNESAEQALLRELNEELNIVPDAIEYFGSFPNKYLYSGVTVFTVDIVFRCFISNLENIKPEDDISGFEFVYPKEIDLEEIPFQSVKNVLKMIRNEQATI